jgi:murein DD-endopeptidase MepM/ murein hydrolase activator NlpD
MTDPPPPSDRPKTALSAALTLFRPVLFASAAIGFAVGTLILLHRAAPPPAPQVQVKAAPPPAAPAPAPAPAAAKVVLPEPTPAPPITAGDFQGFQMKPNDTAEAEPPASDRYELSLRLEPGDTIEKLLSDIDVPEADRKQIDQSLKTLLKKQKLAVGETIGLVIQTIPDQPDAPRVLSLTVRPQPEREYLVLRKDDGSYSGEEKIYKVSPRIVRVETEIQGSLQQSGVRAGAPAAAMYEFIKALAYDVDFQRELKAGQRFTVLLEQLVTSDGKVTHPGRLLAGELRLLKRIVTVVRFRPVGGADQFYNPQGESVVRSFLRTPMDASHITSRFGWREHPILGFSAMHTGVDFGAPMGTPVLAAGAGKVMMAGPNGGYGIFVKLLHTKDIGTGYGHLSRLGPGIRPGAMVRQGQVIGFVGSTGMSTGPHLHYEFYRGGQPVNPLTQKFALRSAVVGKDAARFNTVAREYLVQLKSAPAAASTAESPSATPSPVSSPVPPKAAAKPPQMVRGE